MAIQLSDHFSYKMLIRFSLAPICSMIFTSLYGIVDGFFVSNYAGATAFASLNLVYPFIMMIAGVGFMFGTGGSALVAYHLGMNEKNKAISYFSLIVYTTIVVGIILGALGFIIGPWVSKTLGATEDMLPYCILYLRISMLGIPFFMIQTLFQTFLVTAERPKLGFKITLVAGCCNMLLDYLLVGLMGFGLKGAAFATILSQMVGGVIPLVMFAVNKTWIIHLGKTRFETAPLIKTCSNGVSEFLSSIAMSLVGFMYNFQLLKYIGENGVSAFGVISYVSFIFVAISIGYTMGVSPVVSYHYGADNRDELKNLYRKSLILIFFTSFILFATAELIAPSMAKMFVGYNDELYAITIKGLRISALSYLVMGLNIFGSAFFTALNNGKISAILSVSRTMVFELILILIMPLIFGSVGIWMTIVAQETLGFAMTVFFLSKNGKRYGYKRNGKQADD